MSALTEADVRRIVREELAKSIGFNPETNLIGALSVSDASLASLAAKVAALKIRDDADEPNHAMSESKVVAFKSVDSADESRVSTSELCGGYCQSIRELLGDDDRRASHGSPLNDDPTVGGAS